MTITEVEDVNEKEFLSYEVFAQQLRNVVEAFEDDYRKNHNINPDNYPKFLEESQWWDQFQAWLEVNYG